MLVKSLEQIVGNTPLIELKNLECKMSLKSHIYAKLEYLNPTGSVKDRASLFIIKDAEKTGRLKPGGTIIEATSGNTGIGLAAIGTSRGYRVMIVMPENMSDERKKIIKAYGAELILTPAKEGMRGSVLKAEELCQSIEGSIIAGQFENRANVASHVATTGPEIVSDLNGKVDIFVAGVGTGGTISGTGKYLKERNHETKVIACEPENSPLLSKGVAGPHEIQGIGANFVPDILDRSIIDEVCCVNSKDAYHYAREISKTEGISAGISAGAALSIAVAKAKMPENEDKNIVVILPDSGSRYMSTKLFEEQ